MRIIIFSTFYDPFVGGAEVAMKAVFSRLADRHDIHVITPRRRTTLKKVEQDVQMTIHRVGIGAEIDRWLYLVLGPLRAWKLHRQEAVDISYAVMANQAAVAGRAFTGVTGVPAVLNVQSGTTLEYIKSQVPPGFWWLYKRLYRKANKILAISEFLAQRARSLGATDITVIPNGVDLEVFKPVSTDVREELGIPKDKHVIITTSRLAPKNNLTALISSLQNLSADYELLIIGDGELEEELAQQIADQGVAARLLGRVPHEDLPQYLCAADVFVRASLSEGFGNSFVEAMACEVPVIGTAVGGIPDFLEHEETGLITEKDATSIAQRIQRLCEDKQLRARIKKNAKQMVEQRYDWNTISEHIEQSLQEVTG